MNETGTFVVLVGTGAVMLIDDLRSKGKFNEVQFVALGVVGAIILFVGTFVPQLAFAFACLFGLSVLLNSPTGIPLVVGTKGSVIPHSKKGNVA